MFCALTLVAGTWAALAPLSRGSREVVYLVPKGNASRLGNGLPSTLPSRLRLTVGVRDVLVLRNDDDLPANFGPVLLAPGQTYRVSLSVPGEYPFACSVHRDGQISLVVVPAPTPGWARLSWRLLEIVGL
jgi:hypothetical protein